ncbi:MAG: hypothetical protein H7240_07725 [Glaciimonas sp.]|nr:hypothetical protein [Glaciimonas sp.]
MYFLIFLEIPHNCPRNGLAKLADKDTRVRLVLRNAAEVILHQSSFVLIFLITRQDESGVVNAEGEEGWGRWMEGLLQPDAMWPVGLFLSNISFIITCKFLLIHHINMSTLMRNI